MRLATAVAWGAEIALAQWSSRRILSRASSGVLLGVELAVRPHLRAHARVEHRRQASEDDAEDRHHRDQLGEREARL